MINSDDFPGMTQSIRNKLQEENVNTNEQLLDLKNYQHRIVELAKKLKVSPELVESWVYLAEKIIVNESLNPHKKGTGWVNDNPTGVMSSDEYRRWVHDHVGRSLFQQLVVVFSIVGITGIAVAATMISRANEAAIQTQLGTVQRGLNNKLDEFSIEIKKAVDSQTTATVLNTLTTYSGLREKLQESVKDAVSSNLDDMVENDVFVVRANEAIKEILSKEVIEQRVSDILNEKKIDALLSQALEKQGQQKLIVKSALNAIKGEKGVTLILNSLVETLESTVLDSTKSSDQRKSALLLYSVFRDENDRFRNVYQELIAENSNNKKTEGLLIEALKSYKPTNNIVNEAKFLKSTLQFIPKKNISVQLRSAYITLITNFPSNPYALDIEHWIVTTDSPIHRGIAIKALPKMKNDNLNLVNVLISLAAQEKIEVKAAGFKAIKNLDPNLAIADSDRREQLKKLWSIFQVRVNKSSFLRENITISRFVESFYDALNRQDKSTMQNLYDNVSVKGSSRLKIERLIEDSGTRRAARKAFRSKKSLSRWLDLEYETKNIFSRIDITTLFRSNDANWLIENLLKSNIETSADRQLLDDFVLSYANRRFYLAPDQVAEYEIGINNLDKTIRQLPFALYYTGLLTVIDKSLSLNKVDKEAEFLNSVPDLYKGEKFDKTESFKGAKLIANAFFNEDGTLANRTSVEKLMKTLEGNQDKYVSLLKKISDELKFRRFSDLSAMTLAIRLEPTNGKRLLARSEFYITNNELTKAIADLKKALSVVKVISSTYSLKVAMNGNEEFINLLYKFYNSDINMSNKNKAGALENLAIYYVKNSQWQKAFDITSEVQKIYDQKIWNSILRSLSAYRLGNKTEADKAYRKWLQLGGTTKSSLWNYLDEELTAYIEERKTL